MQGEHMEYVPQYFLHKEDKIFASEIEIKLMPVVMEAKMEIIEVKYEQIENLTTLIYDEMEIEEAEQAIHKEMVWDVVLVANIEICVDLQEENNKLEVCLQLKEKLVTEETLKLIHHQQELVKATIENVVIKENVENNLPKDKLRLLYKDKKVMIKKKQLEQVNQRYLMSTFEYGKINEKELQEEINNSSKKIEIYDWSEDRQF